MIKKYLLLILMLSRLFTGPAQPGKLCFEHLNMSNGLASQYVGQILQDEKGYIWLSTVKSLTRYDGYKLKTYKLDAKQNEDDFIQTILFDGNKTLWVGAESGNLFRLDPVRDTLLPERHVPDNTKTAFSYFFNDRQNNVWALGSQEKGNAFYLEQYDSKNKKSRKFSAAQKGSEFLDLSTLYSFPFVTGSGDIYLRTGNGLYEYDFKKTNFEHYLGSPDSVRKFSIAGLSDNRYDSSTLWLLGKHQNDKLFTLYLFNRHDKTLKACISIKGTVNNSYSKVLFEDRKGRLWLAFKEGLYLYNRQTNDTTEYLFPASDKFVKEQPTAQIKDDTEGNLWLQTNFGVLYFNTSRAKFERYMANPADPDALAHNHVTDIFEDASGLMWVTMDQYGVDRVNKLRSSFRTLRHNALQPGSYPENTIGISERADGNYWLTTQTGLFEWDVQKNYFRKIKLGNNDDKWTSDPISLNNGLYYKAQDALNFYSPAEKPESFRLPGDNKISRLFSSSDKAIWVLSRKGKLYQFDPSNHSFGLYSFVDNSGKNAITDTVSDIGVMPAFYEDRQGILWMSTSNAGLCRIDRVKRTIITSPSLQGGIFKNIWQMFEDSKGNFWLGTEQKGLWLFDRKTGKLVKQIIDKEGLLSARIGGIIEDRNGNLWISSSTGLTKFNYKNNSLFSYTVANSIPFDVPISLTKTNSGEFLLCMFNSIMLFDPDEIKPNPVPPVVHIESMAYSNPRSKQRGEQMINATGATKFSLSFNHNRITFNFVALHYVNSLQNQYAYKLDGFDNNWVQAGTGRKVTYNNLDPGTYTFHVKAANSDGVWSTKDESITVIITPPWWETWWFRILSVIAMITVVYAIVQRHSRSLKKQNIMLEEKVMQRTKELKHSLEELRTTQSQLIQSEKMASLGELTAGIAHEIQNPLNFVNNFSEINKEMIAELKEEIVKGNYDEVKLIANDIEENEEKISHHGKRADAIVKGMLQHSRTSTGAKEPTDINKLADEYLRLAYHGMRAKDKSFNAEIKTELDENIGKINVVQQDIGRVLLNLFNNAFYAVNEKFTANRSPLTADYKPTVSVQTKKINGKVEIIVSDNGNGIPQNIVDKIFQPFFTTKPTGQGTGLGLSLAYDIVKAHGGEIKVETREGEGSVFVIQLPCNP